MKKYRCTVCEYIYDPALGDPETASLPARHSTICPTVGYARSAAKANGPSNLSKNNKNDEDYVKPHCFTINFTAYGNRHCKTGALHSEGPALRL